MSQKKIKRNKGGNKQSKRKIPDIDVGAGEGYYGMVEKVLGHNIISVKLNDNTTRQARIPGKFFKKVWLKSGSKVLLNNDFEVVHVIRDTDVKSSEADRMLRNAGNDGNNIFQDYSDSSDDDDGDDNNEQDQLIKKSVNVDKTKEMLAKKEKEKAKDSERKGGRVFRSADEIEKEMSDLIFNSNKHNSESDGDINIDDI